MAYRCGPNWLGTCWSAMALRSAWITPWGILGLNMHTLGPKTALLAPRQVGGPACAPSVSRRASARVTVVLVLAKEVPLRWRELTVGWRAAVEREAAIELTPELATRPVTKPEPNNSTATRTANAYLRHRPPCCPLAVLCLPATGSSGAEAGLFINCDDSAQWAAQRSSIRLCRLPTTGRSLGDFSWWSWPFLH